MNYQKEIESLGWCRSKDGLWHSHIHDPEADVTAKTAKLAYDIHAFVKPSRKARLMPPDEEICDPHRECRDEIVALSQIVHYYTTSGWPRYTEREAPRSWTPGMQEAQSRAIALVQKLHANSFKRETS